MLASLESAELFLVGVCEKSFNPDFYLVMVDGTFFGDSFEQDRSWDDSATTISGI